MRRLAILTTLSIVAALLVFPTPAHAEGIISSLSVFPSHTTVTGRSGPASMPVASRRTRSPSRVTTVAVTSSASSTLNVMRSTSRMPSPLGENTRLSCVYSATDSAFLRRWATKNAPKVAATRSAKTTRASVLT